MQLEMTPRDKKLLIMLAVFVLVVGIGYWGVYPQIKAWIQIEKDIVEERDEQAENELKVAQLLALQMETTDLEARIAEARSGYYAMMTSDEVDKYVTGMALDYNLYAYDLTIQMPEDTAELEPYQYSQRALSPSADTEEDLTDEETTSGTVTSLEAVEEAASEEDADEEDADEEDSDEEDDETALEEETSVDTGIYAVTVTMRLGGEVTDLARLVEDLSNTDQKLRLSAYSYSEIHSMTQNEDGDYELTGEQILEITVELYMCEEQENADEQ